MSWNKDKIKFELNYTEKNTSSEGVHAIFERYILSKLQNIHYKRKNKGERERDIERDEQTIDRHTWTDEGIIS